MRTAQKDVLTIRKHIDIKQDQSLTNRSRMCLCDVVVNRSS